MYRFTNIQTFVVQASACFWAYSARNLSILNGTLLIAVLCLPFTVHASARIECPQPVFNFGTTNSAARIKHEFELKNTGDEPLEIVSVKCCCSANCSKPAKVVQPGETTTFGIDLSLKKVKGQMKKRLYVRSSDPERVILPLTITGRVVDPVKPAQ